MHRRNIPALILLVIAVVTVWTTSNINWGKDRATRIIKVDGNGYYAYLPAIFIYQDLHFGFFDAIAEKEGYENMGYDYRYEYEGKVINKYFAGTALAQLPFFLGAHLFGWLTGQSMNGYSRPYLIAISLASLFYLLLACFFINKILLHYNISPVNRAIVLLTTVFGTNLFYYSVYEPSMSHVYSLAFASMFVFFILKYFHSYRMQYAILSALFLGMVTFIRPVNLIIMAAIPFLAGDTTHLKEGVLHWIKNPGAILLSLLLFIIPVSIQFILYKLQTGYFWVYSYGEERFHFDQPHVFQMLFSYRKGLFVYTPVWLLSLAGLFYLFKRNKASVVFWLGFFLALTYVLSSWHQWYYGGSFGARVFIEYYALFAIPLGILLQKTKKIIPRAVLITIISLFIVYSVIQTYQYYAGILHWSDMTRELYWEKFLDF